MSIISIRPAECTWVVRAGGAVIAESARAMELREDGHDPVIYFPREDVAMAFLDRTDHSTHCPFKGDATHFSIVSKSHTYRDAVRSYERPKDDAASVAGHLAFYQQDGVTVERV